MAAERGPEMVARDKTARWPIGFPGPFFHVVGRERHLVAVRRTAGNVERAAGGKVDFAGGPALWQLDLRLAASTFRVDDFDFSSITDSQLHLVGGKGDGVSVGRADIRQQHGTPSRNIPDL